MKKKLLLVTGIIIVIFFIGIISIPNINQNYSKVLYSSDQRLLGARLSEDEQWRFERSAQFSQKYSTAVVFYEDQYFFYHPGFNPISITKAIVSNIKEGKIVRGGSTITMQNIRLRRGFSKKRNIFNKLLEIGWAMCLEIKYSKTKILQDYSSMAPFGSNVIGLDAACWRYFEKPNHLLSWAEAALLAILPNNPAMIHPGKNRELLKQKRDRLLAKLFIHKIIDSSTYQLSIEEDIPLNPKPLPRLAPHTLDYLQKEYPSQNIFHTTIDHDLQYRIHSLADWSLVSLAANQINNLGILIAETNTGNVLAYIGNPSTTTQSVHVDHIQAYRSTGSILKPFLHAGAQYRGIILPSTLLFDHPTVIDGFQPKNYSLNYTGAISANKALIQSLNIPFVFLLQSYGIEQFHHDLNLLGIKGIRFHPGHYGLSLILGGGEASLWQVAGAYAYLGRALSHYQPLDNKYNTADLHALNLLQNDKPIPKNIVSDPPLYSVASIYNTLSTLKNVERPDELGNTKSFSSQMPLSWKTGTSYGFRDAWAIGVNEKYTIGVWVGNSTGEGRAGLLGVKVAAPILFEAASLVNQIIVNEFQPPWNELISTAVCYHSGMKPNAYCTTIDTIFICRYQNHTLPCPFHKKVRLDANTLLSVTQACDEINNSIEKTYFQLPPIVEHYYASRQYEYEQIPPLDPRCQTQEQNQPMSIIQPKPHAQIFIPRTQEGNPGKVIFSLAHRRPETLVYWHLDDAFLTTTKQFHEISLSSSPGHHTLTVIDSSGYELKIPFTILDKK